MWGRPLFSFYRKTWFAYKSVLVLEYFHILGLIKAGSEEPIWSGIVDYFCAAAKRNVCMFIRREVFIKNDNKKKYLKKTIQ